MRNVMRRIWDKLFFIKLFWYCSLILALLLLISGYFQRNVIFTIVALIIGISFRYFGDTLVFTDINKRIERRLTK